MKKTISLITPCFNEQAGIEECYAKVRDIFANELPGYEREHIFCDNCSTDKTVDILKRLASQDPSVKIIVNSRNFGILRNSYNGVLSATGDAVLLFLPADLQDPPELLPSFVSLWEQGFEVVFGIRAKREEQFFMRMGRKLYYRVLSRFSAINYPPDVGDFQLVDRKVINAMKLFEDAQPFMRMMTFEAGFRSVGIPYTWRGRKHGVSRNHWSQLFDQAMNGLISFSTVPLRIALILGALISVSAIIYSFGVIVVKILYPDIAIKGVATIIIALFFFSGLQMLFMGLLGEYVLAIYNQVRKRPLVVERERINFKE